LLVLFFGGQIPLNSLIIRNNSKLALFLGLGQAFATCTGGSFRKIVKRGRKLTVKKLGGHH